MLLLVLTVFWINIQHFAVSKQDMSKLAKTELACTVTIFGPLKANLNVLW